MTKLTSSVFFAPETVIGIDDPLLTEGTELVNEHLNRLGAQYFVDVADTAEKDRSGLQGVVVGHRALSEGVGEAIITLDAPFGNGPWPHLVARAEVVSELAFREGLRDDEGKPVPVFLRAAPSATSSFGLEESGLMAVADGDASPIVRVQNDAASRMGFGKIYGDVNWSQPSAHAAVRMTDASRNFDIEGGVLLGDPPHAEPSSAGERVVKFVREGMRFNKSIKGAGIDILKELIHSPKFVRGIWTERAENRAITGGFTQGLLTEDLKALREANIPTTVVRAGDSLITPHQPTVDAVEAANSQVFGLHPVSFVEILGANHSYGDFLGHFGVTAAGIVAVNHFLRSVTPR
ncbi:MAG TPA: hypothetical protein VK674_07285 [Candidatus Limnocylindria bacterium]|nr:hypothetical protein [Candidatus Limnocylindria bacterium]